MRFGILTGGGDAPGLNGIIEAVSRTLMGQGHQVVGAIDGFEGILNGSFREISAGDIIGLHAEAGTFLGTSNKSRIEDKESAFREGYRRMNVAGLIVAGGDGTFAAISKLRGSKIPIIGVPKTIDNDLAGTDVTFGFDTACTVVTEAVDALRRSADSHRRIMVVEAMGRTAGWIALGSGLASYADAILIPERPFNKTSLLTYIQNKREQGRRGLVIVVSEAATAEGESPEVAFRVPGSVQQERYGGVSQKLAHWIEAETGWESRAVVLGHLQRAHAPTTTDRFLTVSLGVEAATMALEGAWQQAVVYRDGKVTRAPLSDLLKPARLVPEGHRWVELVQKLGLFI